MKKDLVTGTSRSYACLLIDQSTHRHFRHPHSHPIRMMISPATLKASLLACSFFLTCGAGRGESVEAMVKQGDVYDLKFNPTEALKFYLPAEKKDPKNVGILLRIARQYRHEMADATVMNEKTRFAGLALDYAKRAVAMAPRDSEAHLSVAICYAKAVEIYDRKGKMDALRSVKLSADQAIALDANNDLAWYILGRWYQRVADLSDLKRILAEVAYGDLPKATLDDAVKCFNKAISLNHKRCVYHVDLGITYAMMGHKEVARKLIEKGLLLPSTGKDDPSTKERGEEILKTLK